MRAPYEERVEVVYVNGIPVQQKVRVKVETAELTAARKALDDLEEELRRSGGTAGMGTGVGHPPQGRGRSSTSRSPRTAGS
jgi:membrane protein involved in colicin uptake